MRMTGGYELPGVRRGGDVPHLPRFVGVAGVVQLTELLVQLKQVHLQGLMLFVMGLTTQDIGHTYIRE